MIYSNYGIDKISSPIYEQVCSRLLTLAKDEEMKRKMQRNII